MKFKALFASLLLAVVATGCCGQVPPSVPPPTVISWSASPSCAAGGSCTYVVSRAAAVNNACQATNGAFYAVVGTTQTLTYTDSAAVAGTSYCWIAQTQQAGLTSQPSCPSNSPTGTCTGTPYTVPAVPLAPLNPSASASTTAKLESGDRPIPAPKASVSKNSPARPGNLVATVGR